MLFEVKLSKWSIDAKYESTSPEHFDLRAVALSSNTADAMERQPLTQQESDIPEGFRSYTTEADVPWKAVYLAVGLLIAGTILLFTGIGLWATDPDAHGMTW